MACPTGPLVSVVIFVQFNRLERQSMVPSPPSAIGTQRVEQDICSCRVSFIRAQTFAEDIVPLKESGMIKILGVLLLFRINTFFLFICGLLLLVLHDIHYL